VASCCAKLPLPGSATLTRSGNHRPDQERTERHSRRGRSSLWGRARHIGSCLASISMKHPRRGYCVSRLGRCPSLAISGCAFAPSSLNLHCSRFCLSLPRQSTPALPGQSTLDVPCPLPIGLVNFHLAGSSFNVDVTMSEDLFVRVCRPLMRSLSSEPAGGLCREPHALVRSPLPAVESASAFGDPFAFAATCW
jgi:hypothetical protein